MQGAGVQMVKRVESGLHPAAPNTQKSIDPVTLTVRGAPATR